MEVTSHMQIIFQGRIDAISRTDIKPQNTEKCLIFSGKQKLELFLLFTISCSEIDTVT